MLKLSKKMLFAIEAVLDIAYNAGDQPVQSSEITRRQGIPKRYLEQVLQQLVRAGILAGVRGPKGGYRLARERRRITVGEIVQVVRSVESAADAADEEGSSELGQTVVRPMWSDLQQAFMSQLDEITIEDLCRKAQDQGIRRESEVAFDYVI